MENVEKETLGGRPPGDPIPASCRTADAPPRKADEKPEIDERPRHRAPPLVRDCRP